MSQPGSIPFPFPGRCLPDACGWDCHGAPVCPVPWWGTGIGPGAQPCPTTPNPRQLPSSSMPWPKEMVEQPIFEKSSIRNGLQWIHLFQSTLWYCLAAQFSKFLVIRCISVHFECIFWTHMNFREWISKICRQWFSAWFTDTVMMPAEFYYLWNYTWKKEFSFNVTLLVQFWEQQISCHV